MTAKHLSRKFLLACFFSLSSTAALFMKLINEGSYIAAMTLILGIYGGSSIADKKMNPGQQ